MMSAPRLPDPEAGTRLAIGHRVSNRRATVVGLIVSGVLHVLVVVIYSLGINEWGPTEFTVAVHTPSSPISGTRIVRIVELTSPDPAAEAPEEDPEPELDVLPPTDPGPVEDEEPGPDPVRASEVLRIKSSDARLWRAARPEAFTLSDADRMQLELAGRLEEWNDSVAAMLTTEAAFTDWTTTDADGNRWGVSPGKLHLGKLTLPLPFYFQGNAWQREQAARRAFEDRDIMNAAGSQAVRASWKERARVIRARRDREKKEAEAKPDSTGTSRSRRGGR